MSSLQIEPSDVIKLLEQYLKENNLLRTLQCLQEETSVSLNTVDSIETFVHDINSGHWDVVLRVVKLLKLPDSKLFDLYEQIAIELIELGETKAAKWFIQKAEPLQELKLNEPRRYSDLEVLLGRSFFDHKEVYRGGSTKERRRSAIADALKKEITVVPPQRLLTLISDALKWQNYKGLLPSSASIDIFTGKAHMVQAEEETHPNVLHKHCITPPKKGDPIFICCAEFSPDGHYIVVGYSTALVEIRNSTTGRLALDLKYQAQQKFIVTPSKSAALSLCFGANDMLAIGDKSGDISIWLLGTGELVYTFEAAHHKSVSCLIFHRNGKEILSGSHDTTVKLHGMRSKKTTRDFRGHRSFVNAVAFSRDENSIITGSSDSTVKIWNAKTAQLLQEYKSPFKVHTVLPMSNFKSDIFLVGNRSNCVQLIDLEGKVRAKLIEESTAGSREEDDDNNDDDNNVAEETVKKTESDLKHVDFYAASSSPKGNWIYAVDSSTIYCFNYSTKKVQKKLLANDESEYDLIGVKIHPFLNLLATFDTKGNLKLWKP